VQRRPREAALYSKVTDNIRREYLEKRLEVLIKQEKGIIFDL
jgi:hypothetical protein